MDFDYYDAPLDLIVLTAVVVVMCIFFLLCRRDSDRTPRYLPPASLAAPLYTATKLGVCECYAQPVSGTMTRNKLIIGADAGIGRAGKRQARATARTRRSRARRGRGLSIVSGQIVGDHQTGPVDNNAYYATIATRQEDQGCVTDNGTHTEETQFEAVGAKENEEEIPVVTATPVQMAGNGKSKSSGGGSALAEKKKTTGALDMERKKLERLFKLDCGDGGGDSDDCDFDDGNGGNDGSGAFVWVTQHTYVQLIIAYYVLSDRVSGIDAREFKHKCDAAFASSKNYRKDSVFAVWVPGKKHQKLIDALEGPSRPALAIHLSFNDLPRANVMSLTWDPRTLAYPRPKVGALTRELKTWLQGEGLRSIKEVMKKQAEVTESAPVLPNQTVIKTKDERSAPSPPSTPSPESLKGDEYDDDTSSTAANAE